MTSPSRKKRQTTPPSITEASRVSRALFDEVVGANHPHLSAADEGNSPYVVRRSSFEASTWLPAALLATLALLASALQAFGGEPTQLQWRPARTSSPSARSAQPAATAPNRHAVHHATTNQRDSRGYVVQVAYDDYGTPDAMGEGQATLRSVLVHPRDPQFEGTGPSYRTAQDPFEDDEISRGIELPFGAEAERPAQDLGNEELPDPIEPTLPSAVDEPDLKMEMPNDEELFNEKAEEKPTTQPSVLPQQPNSQPNFREPRDLPGTSPQSSNTSPRARAKYQDERAKAMESCDTAREQVLSDRITSIELSIANTGEEGLDYPFECILDDGSLYAGRHWDEVTYMWKAAANCHKPLYFEQVQLERYGHTWGPCVQPLVSGAHFFTRLPVLPYCMGITPPNECIYPLGYYRPGDCAPYMIPAVPFTWRAAAFQAGATVGTAAILP